ncbi:MAG TPA: dockerin type I repeat-containing protein [Armatimonadota bacterium]|jgi:hypothetical protein
MNLAPLVALLALSFAPKPITATVSAVTPGSAAVVTYSLPGMVDCIITGLELQVTVTPDTPGIPALTSPTWSPVGVGVGWQCAQGTADPLHVALASYPGQGSGGPMLTLRLQVPADAPPGHSYTVRPASVVMTDLYGAEVRDVGLLPTVALRVPGCQVGDMNGDGRVTLADAQAIGLYLVTGVPPSPCGAGPADVNGDGRVDVRDVAAVLRLVVGG